MQRPGRGAAGMCTAALATVALLAHVTHGQGGPPGRLRGAPGPRPDLPSEPSGLASTDFARRWRDGKAELSGYVGVVPRYGAVRPAEAALIYVTEPHDRRTWIKDDEARGPDRVEVLKLNATLSFSTGIYPYSVMTSVFAPVDRWDDREGFSPTKITLTAQEWCGHVFEALWPGRDRFLLHGMSYFASDGEGQVEVETPDGALYEDALLIQLRELDGPFAAGESEWSGSLVPSLWRGRRAHELLEPRPATIRRAVVTEGEQQVTRFVVRSGDHERQIDVEQAWPRRILGWRTSDGEVMRLQRSTRLAYWSLNRPGDEARRAELGLAPARSAAALGAPEGTRRVGR